MTARWLPLRRFDTGCPRKSVVIVSRLLAIADAFYFAPRFVSTVILSRTAEIQVSNMLKTFERTAPTVVLALVARRCVSAATWYRSARERNELELLLVPKCGQNLAIVAAI